MKRLCIFCGSSTGAHPDYARAATDMGSLLVREKMSLVYGGGGIGLMGTVANAVLEGGGEVIGIIPKALARKEVAHQSLTDLRVVQSMHERKALMAELADGFLALPGGLGTFDEFFEILTWAQLGFHGKPCALLNVNGYFDGMLAFLKHSQQEGFVRQENLDSLLVDTDGPRILDKMNQYQPAPVPKWIDLEDL